MKRPLLLGLSVALLSASPTQAADPLALGRSCTRLFYQRNADALWSRFSPQLQRQFGSKAALRFFRNKVSSDFGQETRVLSESAQTRSAFRFYIRTATFSRYSGGVELQWTFDKEDQVTGVTAHFSYLEAPTLLDDYRTRTSLRLPFEGGWSVLWGGHRVSENRHATVADQRFAYDFLIMKNGSSHEADGSKREQYHCYGRPVLAPGDGTVAVAIDDIPDNFPGSLNPEKLFGNHVVIDHGNGEFSLLGHLKQGSLTVRQGDPVRAGTSVGQVGNSGNSTEPHLHYQLQTAPDYLSAQGMPAQFLHYRADGHLVERGEPGRGQIVEASSRPSPLPLGSLEDAGVGRL